MAMTDGQRAILGKAMTLLGAGSRMGKRLVEEGTAEEVLAHLVEMEKMLARVRADLENHIGASFVVERAKTLSSSTRRVSLRHAPERARAWARTMFERGDFPLALTFAGVLDTAEYNPGTGEIVLNVAGAGIQRRWRVPVSVTTAP